MVKNQIVLTTIIDVLLACRDMLWNDARYNNYWFHTKYLTLLLLNHWLFAGILQELVDFLQFKFLAHTRNRMAFCECTRSLVINLIGFCDDWDNTCTVTAQATNSASWANRRIRRLFSWRRHFPVYVHVQKILIARNPQVPVCSVICSIQSSCML